MDETIVRRVADILEVDRFHPTITKHAGAMRDGSVIDVAELALKQAPHPGRRILLFDRFMLRYIAARRRATSPRRKKAQDQDSGDTGLGMTRTELDKLMRRRRSTI